MPLPTLDDLDLASLSGARVFVRVDFNVPLEGGEVADPTRIEAALPTLSELADAGVRLVLASHCGRPKGEPDPRFSLRPAAERLGGLIDVPVAFAEDCVGELARAAVEALEPGAICVLENLRFHAGEKAGDDDFADALASLADAYVNDAFGTAHRAHASVVGVARRLSRRAAGRLMVREVEALGGLLENPARPFAAAIGGAKIEGKVDTLLNLLPRLDAVLLGGGMANTFLAALGFRMGRSLVEAERLEVARSILGRAEAQGVDVLLPEDLVVTDSLDDPQRIETVPAAEIPEDALAVDVGEATRRRFAERVAELGTLFWNGPLGVFEKPPFDRGTVALAEAAARSPAHTVIGGGETVAAAGRAGVTDRIDHVSTGGGAALELLAGKRLPGVAALEVSR